MLQTREGSMHFIELIPVILQFLSYGKPLFPTPHSSNSVKLLIRKHSKKAVFYMFLCVHRAIYPQMTSLKSDTFTVNRKQMQTHMIVTHHENLFQECVLSEIKK